MALIKYLAGTGQLATATEELEKARTRVKGPEAPLVEALLVHLEGGGFAGAPRFLGVDGRGRQVLSWVER